MSSAIASASRAVASTDGRHHIISNYSTAAEAINATECPVKWGSANAPDNIPMIIRPVNCWVKPIEVGKRMLSTEVYAQYGSRMVDPNTLFTFGACVPEFQSTKLVFTLWKNAKGLLWYACLGMLTDHQRNVDANQDHPEDEWDENRCLLVCEPD